MSIGSKYSGTVLLVYISAFQKEITLPFNSIFVKGSKDPLTFPIPPIPIPLTGKIGSTLDLLIEDLNISTNISTTTNSARTEGSSTITRELSGTTVNMRLLFGSTTSFGTGFVLPKTALLLDTFFRSRLNSVGTSQETVYGLISTDFAPLGVGFGGAGKLYLQSYTFNTTNINATMDITFQQATPPSLTSGGPGVG